MTDIHRPGRTLTAITDIHIHRPRRTLAFPTAHLQPRSAQERTGRTPWQWIGLLTRTVRECRDDNCFGIAAQLAFYFLLALFPALLLVVALVSYVPAPDAIADLLAALETIAPREAIGLIRGQIDQISGRDQHFLLTLALLGALWSTSAAMVALIDALNRAYDVREWRTWWKRRVVAVLLTIALTLFAIIALGLIGVGPMMIARLSHWWALGPAVASGWMIVRWPLLLGCVVVAVDLVYHFAPNRSTLWAWVTPGSAVATVLWLIVSFGFKFYVVTAADFTGTYAAIGGAIVTMLWFYCSGLALLLGAELNAVIEDERTTIFS